MIAPIAVFVRPFNCVGVGEGRALGEAEILSGNIKLAMSHVVRDLVQKVLRGRILSTFWATVLRSGITPTGATSRDG
jgi:hypothetical protein